MTDPKKDNLQNKSKSLEIQEGVDYYFNEKGLMVFTKTYHLKRGYCCKSGCINCPYDFKKNCDNKKKP